MIYYLLFTLTGLSSVVELDSPTYQDRESAQVRLERLWPMCRPSLRMALLHGSSETRLRANRVEINGSVRVYGAWARVGRGILDRSTHTDRLGWLMKVQPSLVRWDMVDYALEDLTGKRMLALWLIIAPFEEIQGLPWVPEKIHREYAKDDKMRWALCDLVNHTWVWPPDERILLGCDPTLKQDTRGRTHILGLDNVRFWIRRIPDPQFSRPAYRQDDPTWTAVTKRWLEEKTPDLKVPDPPSSK